MYRNSLYAIISKLMMAFGKIVFIWCVSHFFGPDGQGLVSIGLTVMVSFALVLSLGIEVSNTYFIGQNYNNTYPLIINSFIITVASIIPSWLLIELAFLLFGKTVFQNYPTYGKIILVLLVPLQVLYMSLQGLFIGLTRFKEIAIATALQYAFLIFGIIFVVKLNMSSLFILYLWGTGLAVFIIYLISTELHLIIRNARPSLILLKQQITYGLKCMIGNAVNFLNFRFDFYIIAYFLTPSHVGWYALASAIAEAILYIPRAISQVIFSAVSGNKDKEKVDSIFRITTLIILIIAFFSIILMPFIIPVIIGKSFYNSVLPSQILILGTFFFGIGFMIAHYIYGYGLPFTVTRVSLISALVTIILDILIIPAWGINGAAICSLIAYFLYLLLNLKALNKIRTNNKSLQLIKFLFPSGHDIKRVLFFAKESLSLKTKGWF